MSEVNRRVTILLSDLDESFNDELFRVNLYDFITDDEQTYVADKQIRIEDEYCINQNDFIKNNGCKYCNGQEPLTDKVYDDGSKFSDTRSTKIEHIGKVPVIISSVKERYFDIFIGLRLSNEDKKYLSTNWAVEINYCPICGRKLTKGNCIERIETDE